MLRTGLKMIIALVAAILMIAPASAQSTETALLRFVNVIPGAASLDIFVDGQLAAARLDYGEASLYIPAPAGAHTVVATQAGVTTTLWEQEINANAGAALTLVASSTDSLGFQTFLDDLNPLSLGQARLTAIHAIAGAGAVDITLADGRAVIPGLTYNVPYGTLDVPSAVYEVLVVPEGDSVENAIIGVTPLKLNSSTSYMVIAYGTTSDANLLILSAPTLPEDAGSFTGGFARVAHAIPGAPEVDVYLDDTLIAPSLALGDSTVYMALPSGEYEVNLRLPGEPDALESAQLTVAEGQYTSTLALGTPENVAIESFASNLGGITPEMASLLLVNALADGSATVSTSAGNEIVTDVAAGSTASAELAPAEETLVVSTDVSDATVELNGSIYGGVFYEVVVVSGDGGPEVIALPPVSINMNLSSAPGDTTLTPPATIAPTEPPAAPTEAAAQPTSAPGEPTPAPATPAPTTATSSTPMARVNTNPAANVHMRQFPNSEALSLALIPSGSTLEVLGRPGAPAFPVGVTVTPDPSATPFVDPATQLEAGADLDPATTWLFVQFNAPDGGTITGWANALYLIVTAPDGRTQRLADLPVIPENRAGQVNSNFELTPVPTTPFENTVVATIDRLSPGANLHLRRTPSASSESLALIPAGTQLPVSGRLDTGEWYQVEYNGQTGWISAAYVSLSFNGSAFEPERVPVLATPTPTPTVEPTQAA
ncbi:MAG: LPXTG-motif cell wall anchor domain-containing protein [Chloroflexi bacterium OLB15]|nr:MAG: LPXTG-motif cell wall anchor domain-containing protein [Chloroflexi bacterium OLB15]